MHEHHDHEHNHDHDDEHEHSHGIGGHHHHEAPTNFSKAFAIGIGLNTVFVIAEIIYGIKANSLALIADAGHNIGDVLGLILAWIAAYLGTKKPNAKFTYGLKSSSILAALTNSIILLIAIGGIGWEAVRRFSETGEIAGQTVIVIALLGVVINGITAFLFMSGSKHDLNIKAAFLHMAADAAISLGVAVSGVIIIYTGLNWIDPTISLIICGIIGLSTIGILKESMDLMLKAVPKNIDITAVRKFIESHENITQVHDLHIWAISTNEAALSAHIVVKDGAKIAELIHNLNHDIKDKFGISHSTIQAEQEVCGFEC